MGSEMCIRDRPRLDVKSTKAAETKEYDKALFARMKHLRKAIADEHNVPPFVIFSDATLIDMVQKLPMSKRDMLSVSGVGETKLERYGSAFLTLIEEYAAS